MEWTFRAVVFTALAFILPKVATLINTKVKVSLPVNDGLNMLLPKIAVALVLGIFFVTQFQLYFSSPEILNSLGYSYSRYTNEVFAQLSAVAVVILAILYCEVGKKPLNKIMSPVLSVQGVFLTFMAYKSVYEYSLTWGFTYKRLYGFFCRNLDFGHIHSLPTFTSQK